MTKRELIVLIKDFKQVSRNRLEAIEIEEEEFTRFKAKIGMDNICGNRCAALDQAKILLAEMVIQND